MYSVFLEKVALSDWKRGDVEETSKAHLPKYFEAVNLPLIKSFQSALALLRRRNDNDNDTLREVHPTSVSGLAIQA